MIVCGISEEVIYDEVLIKETLMNKFAQLTKEERSNIIEAFLAGQTVEVLSEKGWVKLPKNGHFRMQDTYRVKQPYVNSEFCFIDCYFVGENMQTTLFVDGHYLTYADFLLQPRKMGVIAWIKRWRNLTWLEDGSTIHILSDTSNDSAHHAFLHSDWIIDHTVEHPEIVGVRIKYNEAYK